MANYLVNTRLFCLVEAIYVHPRRRNIRHDASFVPQNTPKLIRRHSILRKSKRKSDDCEGLQLAVGWHVCGSLDALGIWKM